MLFRSWLLRFAHPFMPFVTEEIWQHLADRKAGDSICVADYPLGGSWGHEPKRAREVLSQVADVVEELLVPLRNYRNANQISPKTQMEGIMIPAAHGWVKEYLPMVKKLGNTGDISFVPELSGQVFAGKRLDWSLPMEERELNEEEKAKLIAELEYTRGFLAQVEQKLSNERFVANAKPDLVEKERQKKTDAESKIAALEKILG
mgnify:CR=1 FL=1